MGIAANAPMAPISERRLRDYLYIANSVGPAAGTNTNTAGLDLIQPQVQTGQSPGAPNTAFGGGSSGPYSVTERFWVNVSATAGGNTANNKNVNIYLQHSSDNATWVNIPELAVPFLRIVDGNGAGFSATGDNVMLPPSVKRYIRGQVQLEANGGTSNDSTISVQLYF